MGSYEEFKTLAKAAFAKIIVKPKEQEVPDSEAPEFTLGRFVEFSRKLLNQYASDFEAALENFLEMKEAGNLPPHIFSDAYV